MGLGNLSPCVISTISKRVSVCFRHLLIFGPLKRSSKAEQTLRMRLLNLPGVAAPEASYVIHGSCHLQTNVINWQVANCLMTDQLPYAPYLARQFSKPHRSHNFEARKLKFGTNVVPWSMYKCINFQLIISDTSGTIYFLVMVPKKSCAHQYNEKFKNFATFVHLNCCVAFECGFAGA